MSTTARYDGICDACDNKFYAGDEIGTSEDYSWSHVDCIEGAGPTPAGSVGLCGLCRLRLEVEGAEDFLSWNGVICHAGCVVDVEGAGPTPAVNLVGPGTASSGSGSGPGLDLGDVVSVVAPRPEPKRDGKGRYILPLPPPSSPWAATPGKGKRSTGVKSYTRATSMTKRLDNQYALNEWDRRQLARGMGMKEELWSLAAAHNDPHGADRKLYENIIERAKEAAGSNAKSSTGTALHRFTELLDTNAITLDEVPGRWRGRCEQYVETLKSRSITIIPELVERIYIDDRYGVAGTGDRGVGLSGVERPAILDLKTGSTIRYSYLANAMQLAIYQDHTDTYDVVTDRRLGPVDMDSRLGLIVHLPADGTTCEVWEFDLALGRQAYENAVEQKTLQDTKAERIAKPYVPSKAQLPYDWLAGRLWALAPHPGAEGRLRAGWPSTVPQPLPVDPTPEQVKAMDEFLAPLETLYQTGWYPSLAPWGTT